MQIDDVDVADGLQQQMTALKHHTCDSTCKIRNPTGTVVQRGSSQVVLWEWDRPRPGDVRVRTVSNVFVCEVGRCVHLCTEECEIPKITNSEHCHVCPISGLQWHNDTELTRSWKNAAKCMPSISTIKSDPNRFCRDANGSVIRGSLNLTTQSCRLEVKRLLQKMLFSQIRKQSEFAKYLDGTVAANKLINKYVRHCGSQSKPINVSTMYTLYVNTVFKQPNFFRTQQRVSLDLTGFADLLIAYWTVLMPTYSFSLFVPACLYLMRSGVCVNGTWIINVCPRLETILPEASSLDIYGVTKAVFTHTKNLILRQIRLSDTTTLPQRIRDAM